MEGTGLSRVARDSVQWIEAASAGDLAEQLRRRDSGVAPAAYGIRLDTASVDRRWVYGSDEFLALWRQARSEGFTPAAITAVFFSRAPALTIRSGEVARAPSYESDTGHVWVANRPSTRPPRRAPRRAARRAPRRKPDDGDSLYHSDLSTFSYADDRPRAKSPAPRVTAEQIASGQPLRRVPHIDVTPAEPLQASADLRIEVYCDTAAARPGEEAGEMTLELPPGRHELTLQVWLALSRHFVPEPGVGAVTVSRGEEESTRAPFDLRVVDDPPPGPGRVTAVFHHDGRTSGQVTRLLEIEHGAAASESQRDDRDDVPAPPPRVEVRADAKRAGLTVEIKSLDGGEQRFACRVITDLLPGYESPEPTQWTLNAKAPTLVADYMRSFTAPGLPAGQRVSRLEGAGMDLWRAAPEELREVFWKLIDDDLGLETIFVVSDEGSFPWELVVPNRGSGSEFEARKPLGVEFAVGRWVTDVMIAPPQRVDVVDSYVFAPRYTGRRLLKKAAAEAKYVVDHLNGEAIEPGDYDPLEAKFAAGGVALAHFVCHGTTSDGGRQLLRLEGGGTLEPQELQAMPGLRSAIADRKPLVFLNACEVGRNTPALVGVNGFAAAFARIGATCVIAPVWNVADDVAHLLATGLYDSLRANPSATPAGVLRQLRDNAYAAGGADSWAAYCFYGDPLTEVVIR